MDVKRCFMWTLIVTFYCYFTTAMQEKVVWKVQKLLYHIKHHRPILQLCIKDWTHGSSVLWNAGEAVGVVWSLRYSVHRNNPALTKCAQKCCYCYCHWSTALLPQLSENTAPEHCSYFSYQKQTGPVLSSPQMFLHKPQLVLARKETADLGEAAVEMSCY